MNAAQRSRGQVEALNADPSPIAQITIEDVVDHYEKISRNLDGPPIIMGHSFGVRSRRSCWIEASGQPAWASPRRRSKGSRICPGPP